MTIPSIKKIIVLCNEGTYATYELNMCGVTEIIDKSKEFPDSQHNIYHVMNGDTLIVELVNLPVIVEHFN